ncbi:AlwI family type II restriction endonuclease [Patescibacteria group bacterium]|nr:AlwI family type II restriction endonuclease [Patescibacteria group bacterium]
MKQWNIGNTTIRNPNRIKDGLSLLQHFEGKIWDYKTQREFYDKAKETGIMDSKEDTKEKEFHARKWASCLNQLGFARAWKAKNKGPIVITKIGKLLINDEITFEEAMLRQLLKYQLPSSLEKGKEYENFKVHPFRVFLETIYKLYEKGINGLTKEEISLFVITTLDNKNIDEAVEKIKNYREKRSKIKGGNPKLALFKSERQNIIVKAYKEETTEAREVIKKLPNISDNLEFEKQLRAILFGKEPKKQVMTKEITKLIKKERNTQKAYEYYLEEFVKTKGATLKDYGDSQVRYVLTTGIFSLNRDRIVLKENKIELVKSILETENKFIEESKYEDYFYNPEEPRLPLDNVEFMLDSIIELQRNIEKLSEKTGIVVEPITTLEKNIPQLKKINIDLEKELIIQKEYIFYKNQGNEDQINDIVEYFDMIKTRTLLGGDAYFPAYYEWSIWRVFLAINTLVGKISDTRNFEIDEELKPIHHAKGGVPDMMFEYEDFSLVCEGTLHQSVSQWSAEYTSVPKHVGEMASRTKKETFGVFVAPRIEPNMAQQLFNASWHIDGDFMSLNIIPLSTDQLIEILRAFAKYRFSVKKLKEAFEEMTKLKKECSNGKEWHEKISKNFQKFFQNI